MKASASRVSTEFFTVNTKVPLISACLVTSTGFAGAFFSSSILAGAAEAFLVSSPLVSDYFEAGGAVTSYEDVNQTFPQEVNFPFS